MSRSPLELLDAVLDEVEGLRRTDARSFLPAALVRELRAATAPAATMPGTEHQQHHDLADLVGRTITHVFDADLRRGDAVIMCADGGFVVLEAERDGDETAYLRVHTSGHAINEYLRPRDLMTLGLMSAEEKRKAEEQERVAAAEQAVQRAQAQLKRAQETLEKLRPAPVATTTEGSAANG